MRVVTYNIHHGVGMDGVLDLERIEELLIEARPDVVALNEVDKGIARSRRVDQSRVLAERLGMEYAFGPNLRYFGGEYGNAILSRFPIRSHRNVPLTARGSERRGLLHAVLDVVGSPVHVLTTHLEVRHPNIRDAQLMEIARYVQSLEGPVILMGDFNSDAGMGDPSGALFPRLRDTWVMQQVYFGENAGVADGGPQEGSPTFDSKSPSRRIDYVFASQELLPVGPDAVRTVHSLASDHLPVVADLHFIETAIEVVSPEVSQGAGEREPPIEIPARAITDVVSSGTFETDRLPSPGAFVSDLESRERDKGRFAARIAPGFELVEFDLDQLVRLDLAAAPEALPFVVMHNQKVITRSALEWLVEYKRRGGALVAVGNVGLRLADATEIPPEGSIVADLFSVRVAGWTRSHFAQKFLYDCETGDSISVPTQGMLHLEPMGDGKPVLSFDLDCERGDALSAAVMGEGTLYVGIDPLARQPAPQGVIDALRRAFSALLHATRTP